MLETILQSFSFIPHTASEELNFLILHFGCNGNQSNKEVTMKPEDQWSCKHSPEIWAYYKYKNKFRKIWHCRKIDQGQLRVIIYINFVELRYIMLHAKFQDHRTISSVGEDFRRFLSYMGMAATLVMWPGPIIYTFFPPSQGGSKWNLALIGQAVSQEKMFENNGHIHVYSPRAGADNPLG